MTREKTAEAGDMQTRQTGTEDSLGMKSRSEATAWRGLGVVVILFFLGLSLGGVIAVEASDGTPATANDRVLVLHSYHVGFSWADHVTEGIRTVFHETAPHVELLFEFMDVKRRQDEAYLDSFRDFLWEKYGGQKIDLVISADDHALDFLLGRGGDLFPKVPLVFCAVNGYDPEKHRRANGLLTGVVETLEIGATLETALSLHPEARRVAYVSDGSLTGKALKRAAEAAFAPFEDRVSFQYIEHRRMDQLKRDIGALRPGTIVLAFIFGRDDLGRIWTHEYNLQRMASACSVPIYSFWEFYLGHGIVGGRLTSGRAQGKTAAMLAVRILNGERAEDIPVVMESPNHYMFDHVELARFGIDPAKLPEGSTIINTPYSVYDRYKLLIWTATGFMMLLVVLVIVLTRNVLTRRRVEKELRTHREELRERVADRTRALEEINKELHIRTQKLERSNADLERFAYVASHDLREPLRMVGSFVGLLEKRYKDQIDDKANQYISYTVSGVNRMQRLIDDLLSYSRVDTYGRAFESTDMEAVLEETLVQLKLVIDETDARITHDPLPEVTADAVQMGQVFQNLIENAIKFRGERRLRIHIGCEQVADLNGVTGPLDKEGPTARTDPGKSEPSKRPEWIFRVQDNGIGIKKAYWGRIFEIFQRLHGRDDFPGTGIGLAVCKKIVERHGGTMWVESEEGKGSTFYFSLPAISQDGTRSAGRGAANDD